MGSRQEAALQTRKKLTEAGKKIICEKGLTNTSIEEITEAAGVSKGTFYTYFKRKEDIVFALSQSMFGEILEKAQNTDGDFLERLKVYMTDFSGYIEQSGVNLAQDWIRNVVDPRFADDENYRGKLSFDISSALGLIEAGVKKGLLKKEIPEKKMAYILTEVLYGQLLCWCISGGSYSLRKRAEEFCDMCLEDIFGRYLVE